MSDIVTVRTSSMACRRGRRWICWRPCRSSARTPASSAPTGWEENRRQRHHRHHDAACPRKPGMSARRPCSRVNAGIVAECTRQSTSRSPRRHPDAAHQSPGTPCAMWPSTIAAFPAGAASSGRPGNPGIRPASAALPGHGDQGISVSRSQRLMCSAVTADEPHGGRLPGQHQHRPACRSAKLIPQGPPGRHRGSAPAKGGRRGDRIPAEDPVAPSYRSVRRPWAEDDRRRCSTTASGILPCAVYTGDNARLTTGVSDLYLGFCRPSSANQWRWNRSFPSN